MKIAGRHLVLVLVPLILLALIFYARQARDRLRASATASQVERLTLQLQGSGRLSRPDANVGRALQAGLEALRGAAEDDPAEVAVPIAQAALYRLLGRPQAAVRAYEEGLAIESRPEIYAQLGHTLWGMEEPEAARQAFRRAVSLDHNLARELRIYLPALEEHWRKRRETHRHRRAPGAGEAGDEALKPAAASGESEGEGTSEGGGRARGEERIGTPEGSDDTVARESVSETSSPEDPADDGHGEDP